MLAYKCSTKFPIRAGEVRFGLLSSEEIERMSTCHVKDTTIYYRGLPNPNGINDHRMGTVDRRLLCGTCCKDVRHCQGHVGHIKLSFPMYHIGFFDTTFKCLRCVCFACSNILLSTDEQNQIETSDMGKTQFTNIYNSLKNKKRCPHCNFPQPTYVRGSLTIKTEWPIEDFESEEEKKYSNSIFTQKDALSILMHVSDKDCKLLGLDPNVCHPKNMILTTILVPPPVARPAIMASEGSRSRGQDDLTHKLQDINKRSIELFNFIGEKHWMNVIINTDILEKISKLQFEVFTYMNNNIRGQKQSTQRSGAPTKSLTDRLKGKDGRIRGNLMGKRVDFSARSVITPDAVMDVDQVGIPERIAMSLTIPERVTSLNIEQLTKRVVNGCSDIFGAENVITSNGVMINLNHCENREKIRLQYGWIVERYLQDDDVVIFNRQPSLHKMGMMGHRVKLMKGSTFRLNLCCANPYNADFDGDEMNLHVPQSPAAIADVALIMMVSRQVISPQANKPVMGIVQDSLLGAHLFSKNDVFIDKTFVCHLLAGLKYTNIKIPEPCIMSPKKLWSGKQLLSMIIPKMSLGLEFETPDISKHNKCFVRNGIICTGTLNKSLLGSSAGGFVDILFREYGSSICIRWMSEIQRLVNAWLMIRGFSVSIKDCVLSEKGEERVKERITTAMRYAEELLKEPIEKGSPEHSVLESTIVRILSKTLMQTGGIVDEELNSDNAIRNMVNAGSKGNPINLSQICGCVGQQSVEGHRVFAEKGGRTLTCFEKIDNSLAGQGFVQNSYALGLHPHEYFFHAMGGREGLVDTAVKTATTGYIQRRQIKAMEDHKVCYDGTVRNAEEYIIDFSYGGDGMDAARVERVKLNILEEETEDICERMTQWEAEEAIFAKNIILQTKLNVLITDLDSKILLPFNPYRMHLKHNEGDSATFDEIEEIVRYNVNKKKSAIYKATLLDFFCSSKLYNAKLSINEIQNIFKKIEKKWTGARINYGEMVGSIAAQSIGEPCTQMTLNTFHFAGVISKNVTLGIPRLKELLDQAKTIKTPSNTIRLIPELSKNREFAAFLADTLPLTRLSDIVSSCDFVYDPDDDCPQSSSGDKFMVDMNALIGIPRSEKDSNYVIRLILNQSLMKTRRITPPIVRTLLRTRLHGKAHIISSETNDVDWVIRIRLEEMKSMMKKLDGSTRESEGLLCHRVMSVLLDTVAICGHKDIQAAFVRDIEYNNEKHYVVDTQGCNLIDLSAIPCVDWTNTVSNDLNEIHATLGLEAAVGVLYNELTVTISFDGTYVDPRHIMMIVNTMTRGGYIMPLSRHGINRMDTGPLLRCSFEETPDILCDAACFGEVDNGKGVSQNIMTGKLAGIGSGYVDLKMNSSMMHPREIQLETMKIKKVLKSSVRIRPSIPTQVELFEINKLDSINTKTEVELPFDTDKSSIINTEENIFSKEICEAPYKEETNVISTNKEIVNIVYRPSSPILNE